MSEHEMREEEKEIYPDDIEIFDYEKRLSDLQILSYALGIGYYPRNDPKEFLEIAKECLNQPLPNKWRRAFEKLTLQFMYIDLTTNEIHLSTDIEEKAKIKIKEKRAIYEEQFRKKIKEMKKMYKDEKMNCHR